jgi:hypothetical protein
MSDDATHDWHGTAVAAALGACGLLADLVIVRAQHAPWWPNVAAAAVCLTSLTLLLAGWRNPRAVAAAFVANNAAIVAALWIGDSALARTVPGWTPFRGHELGILAVALLAPRALWAGIASMALLVGSALGEWALLGADVRSRLPPGQLPIVAIYTLFGVTLLVFRLRMLAAERARVRAETEAAGLERLARTLLAVRDLANTPLQTLEISVALLRERKTEIPVIVDRIERAVAALEETQQALAAYDAHLRWEHVDESFDPLDVLKATASPSKPK